MIDTRALRQKVLDLAIRGKLVPQDPNDEPASVLLERIRTQKQQMVKEGKLKVKDIKNDTVIFVGEDNLHYEKFADGSVKCIEDEIPFEIPAGWEWTRLGTLAHYKKGPFGSSITKSMFIPESDDAIKVYEQQNAINKSAKLGHYFISQDKFEELNGFEVFPGDVIVSCAGTIGETFIMPQDMRKGIINQALMKISLYDDGIKSFYLMYFDSKLKALANEQGYGMALKNIPPFDVLKQYLMPIPPQEEQLRILEQTGYFTGIIEKISDDSKDLQKCISLLKSKILDLAIRGQLVPQNPDDEPASVLLDRIRAEKEELIKAGKVKRDKKESIIFKGEDNSYYEKIGDKITCIDDLLPFEIPDAWSWVRMKEVCIVNPRNNVSDNTEVSFIPMPLIQEGFANSHSSESRTWAQVKTGFTHFRENDVGVAKITPCFENRKSVVFHNLKNGIGSGTTELHILRSVDDAIIPEYILAILKTNSFISGGVQTFSSAVGQQRISKDYVAEYLVPLPPYGEQRRICDKVAHVLDMLSTIEASLS